MASKRSTCPLSLLSIMRMYLLLTEHAPSALRTADIWQSRTQISRRFSDLHTALVNAKKWAVSINAVEEDQRIASAWIDHAEGRNDEAVEILRKVAAREQGIFAPDGGIAAHEMLGDILNDMGRTGPGTRRNTRWN